jgi:hypothetical protein
MGRRRRRQVDSTQNRDANFFHPGKAPVPGDPFFKPTAVAGGPMVQKEDAPTAGTEEEKKDPLAEGLKTTAGKLAENDSFKKWYEPRLARLKYTLWDKASPAEKAGVLTFAGLNLGMLGAAFASNPQLRSALSGVNIGAPLGLLPYSPLKTFSYTEPGAGKTATDFSTELTLDPYLEKWKGRPSYVPSGVSFGFDSSYDPKGGDFRLTGGKFGLDFLGGALKAEGKTFNSLSPYPMLMPGMGPGYEPTWSMNQTPGMPDQKLSGFQFMLSADVLKLFPGLKKRF